MKICQGGSINWRSRSSIRHRSPKIWTVDFWTFLRSTSKKVPKWAKKKHIFSHLQISKWPFALLNLRIKNSWKTESKIDVRFRDFFQKKIRYHPPAKSSSLIRRVHVNLTPSDLLCHHTIRSRRIKRLAVFGNQAEY